MTRGPTAEAVANNVRRLREQRGLSLPELSERLTSIGRPILPSGISKIELAERRVDVDDLMALAVALAVNPSALLLPHTTEQGETYEITGASGVSAHQVWDWADGRAPLTDPNDDERDLDFQLYARPKGRRVLRSLPGRRIHELTKGELEDWRGRLYPGGIDWTEVRSVGPELIDSGDDDAGN